MGKQVLKWLVRRRCGVVQTIIRLPCLALVVLSMQTQPGSAAQPLKLEDIFSEHGLTGPAPSQFQWSPDGTRLSYILPEEDRERRNLWVITPESGEKEILVSYEQLRKLAPPQEKSTDDEREKERLLRYSVASYIWSPDSQSILFTSGGRLYLYRLDEEQAWPVAPSKAGVRDPKFSPNGRWISFIYEHDIWLAPTTGGDERHLTTGASDRLLHGDLDWIYPEEFGVRTGYHWSPDSNRIAFLQLNQGVVPEFPITYLAPTRQRLDIQRYPKAGDANPIVRVGIIEAKPGRKRPKIVWVEGRAEYTPRVNWADETTLAIQRLNRDQNQLELFFTDATLGRPLPIIKEKDPYWINVTNDLTFLPKSRRFLWTSERSGFRHIEMYGFDGKRQAALTEGEWEVSAIQRVDEEGGWVYYTSNEDQPLGKDLYRVQLDGGDKQRLTRTAGTHAVKINPNATAYLDSYSSLKTPSRTELRTIESEKPILIHKTDSLDQFDLAEPELLEWRTPDKALVRGLMLKPRAPEPGRKHPVLIYVYGGPHTPTIRDAWGSRGRPLFHQYLTQKGYVVFYLDDRTSSLLGHRYEAAAHKQYGPVALTDYEFAVKQIQKMDFVDPNRIAIWGWSGGGFSTCYALTHSNLFKLGIAVAPVTDWRLYDSIYTERYMGLPAKNKEAYDNTSAVKSADQLHGRLLLVHPTADDNVHFQNTIQMIDALIQAGKPYDLLIYPGKTHSLHGEEERLHLFRSIEEYLDDHL